MKHACVRGWPAVPSARDSRWFHAVRWMAVPLFLLAWINPLSAAPRIEFDHQYWNFGVVTNVPSISHDYWISNSGDAPLVITSIASTCPACLHASIEETNLPPGSTTVVHAKLDLRLLSGPTSRAILINCNDPQNPTPVLELNGEGIPLYQLDPVTPLLDLAEGPDKITIGINPLVHLHAPLSQVVYNNTNVQASLASAKGGGWFLTVAASSSFPKSNATVTVVIRSSDTNDPACTVDVFIRNAPVLELLPPQLLFAAQTNTQTRVLWIKQHGPSPLALLDAVLPQDKFHNEIDPDPDGRDYTIYVTTWQQQSAAGQTNELVLRMMDASNREQDINVPVVISRP